MRCVAAIVQNEALSPAALCMSCALSDYAIDPLSQSTLQSHLHPPVV